ncbi:MAG: hypothetical protein WDO56_08920 [Gammaproteobacteria bacterium]
MRRFAIRMIPRWQPSCAGTAADSRGTAQIGSDASRERFARLLVNANIELDEAGNPDEALARLERRIHALLLTDSVDLIRRARQLQSGPATHIVFIDIAAGAGYAEALRAGANDCLSERGSRRAVWAQLTTARRIVDLAASLQLALTDNRICRRSMS